MRVFLDTNVLVAAVVARAGLTADLVERLLMRHTLVVSPQVLTELARTLPQCGLDAPTCAAAVAFIDLHADHVPAPTTIAWHCRDADDDAIVTAAIGCDALVTGDRDLLEAAEPPIPILNPRACWAWLDEVERCTR